MLWGNIRNSTEICWEHFRFLSNTCRKKKHKLYLCKDQTQTSESVTVTAKSNVSARISDETKCRTSKDKKKKYCWGFKFLFDSGLKETEVLWSESCCLEKPQTNGELFDEMTYTNISGCCEVVCVFQNLVIFNNNNNKTP